jgi:uncharacterized membrane protein YeiH
MNLDSVISVLDMLGIAVFAVSGALVAARKEMDIVGFMLIGTVTGIGGGTLRDLLLGSTPVFWVKQPAYVLITIGASALTYFFARFVASRMRWLTWADAVGLSVFCIIGAEAARAVTDNAVIIVVMAMLTATFGGILRDILCGEFPLLLKPEIYATAALVGATAYLGLLGLDVGRDAAAIGGIGLAFAVRGAAIAFNLKLPTYGPRPPT